MAELLKTWLKGVIQATEPYISTEDVDKGSIWFSEIGDTLAETNIGIICLTRSNKGNPWILFEAGALSKGLSKSRVWTFLVDLDFPDLEAPLSQFNGTKPTKEDVKKLLVSVNKTLEDKALPNDVLAESFEQWWPRFEQSFQKIAASAADDAGEPEKRSIQDMVEELLQLTRSIHQSQRFQRGSALAKRIEQRRLEKLVEQRRRESEARSLVSQLLEMKEKDPNATLGSVLYKALQEEKQRVEKGGTDD